MTNPTVTPNGGDIAEGVFGRKGCQAVKGRQLWRCVANAASRLPPMGVFNHQAIRR